MNIFDLKNTKDIPDELIKEALWQRKKVVGDLQLVLDLFEIKNILTAPEVIIGCYRKYQIQKTRKWAISVLWRLGKKGSLKKVPNTTGTWKLVRREEV